MVPTKDREAPPAMSLTILLGTGIRRLRLMTFWKASQKWLRPFPESSSGEAANEIFLSFHSTKPCLTNLLIEARTAAPWFSEWPLRRSPQISCTVKRGFCGWAIVHRRDLSSLQAYQTRRSSGRRSPERYRCHEARSSHGFIKTYPPSGFLAQCGLACFCSNSIPLHALREMRTPGKSWRTSPPQKLWVATLKILS